MSETVVDEILEAPDAAEVETERKALDLRRRRHVDLETARLLLRRGWRQVTDWVAWCSTCGGMSVWLDQNGMPSHHFCASNVSPTAAPVR